MSSTTPLVTTTAPTHHPPSIERLTFLIDKPNSIHHLLQTHALLLRHNLHHHHPILNFKLQRSYASLGRLDYSVALFRRTQNPTVFFWSSIINSHSKRGLHDLALMFYTQMLTNGVQPNCFTFSALMKSCSIDAGKFLHCQTIKFGFDSDLYVRTGLVDVYARAGDVVGARQLFDTMPERSLVSLTAMITCYAKRGEVDEARVLFDGMKERDVVCWNVMIDGYAQHGMPNEALLLFRKMLVAKVKPDGVTVLSLLSACGQIGALESGRWLHSYIENNGIRIDVQGQEVEPSKKKNEKSSDKDQSVPQQSQDQEAQPSRKRNKKLSSMDQSVPQQSQDQTQPSRKRNTRSSNKDQSY